LKRLVAVLVGAVKRLFTLEIAADGLSPAATLAATGDAPGGRSPLVVLARHAGPADSLLVLHQVMSWQGRRPRIVAKDLLQLDPALDILLNRLPNRFISPNPAQGEDTVAALGALAADMDATDAFVIFPEGGNFTEKRRVRAIERLRAGGYARAAQRASELRNVLPPRPAGTIAVLAACPAADVVFVAHTGLDQIGSISDLWAAIPEQKTLEMNWHLVPSKDVPSREDEREEMLFLAWDSIDAWVEERRSDHKLESAR
jgi:1-acyl-sn-glycerol-3-phosphate acyltransferase